MGLTAYETVFALAGMHRRSVVLSFRHDFDQPAVGMGQDQRAWGPGPADLTRVSPQEMNAVEAGAGAEVSDRGSGCLLFASR